MFRFILPFLPPVALFGAVYFFEICSSSSPRRIFAWAAVTTCSLIGIFKPSPYNDALLNYLAGFFSSWYIIWSANLLLIKDITTLQRIQKQPSSCSPAYIWQPLPCSHSLPRLFWAVDLTLNFRAIGWNFSSRQSHHPPATQTRPQTDIDSRKLQVTGPEYPETRQPVFLWQQVRRLLVSWAWFVGYPCLVRGAILPFPAAVQRLQDYVGETGPGSLPDLLSVATTLYMFMDGVHAVVSLIAVWLLRDEQWKYPPFFGPVEYLISGKFQDLWGKFWHDLLKEGLLTAAKGAAPWKQPKPVWTVVRIWTCFVLTGAVHASASYVVSNQALPSLYAGVFYCLQPVGILIQMSITGAIRGLLPNSAVSVGLQRILEFSVGLVWLCSCFPWVSNDPALRLAIGTLSFTG